MTSFSRLPDELLLLVAQQLATQPDIYHLAQVNARCYRALHSHLCAHNVQHHGSTALLWAAQKGNLPVIAKLLAAGANIVTKRSGRTASARNESSSLPRIAAQGSHTAALQLMLEENRPNQAASLDQLRTLLHRAIRAHDGPLVDLLVGQRRALFDSRTYRDWPSPTTPDTWPSALNVALEAEHYTIVPRLLFLQQGWMPHRDHGICYIADTNNIAMLQVLLDYGLDLRLYGTGAVCVAIWVGHYDMVKMLLDHGASTRLGCIWESTDRSPQMDGYTPVGFAVKWKRLEILRLLLDSGAHADWTDFDMAREQGFEEAADLLLEFEKSDPEPLTTVSEEAGGLLFGTPIELLDPDLVVPDRVELLVLDVPGGVTDASQIWEGMSRYVLRPVEGQRPHPAEGTR
ncbi:ankyrin [Aspergillus brunneoviolaceus CBS 621.78]|uniref:Ankyrin n=1 Tax=Aspergillus brunneoviolaceus CBS 621.78 TaxID=1450534 RepID=A0ACD1GCZ5_9EURO|nr:ankyrin [Aspergillus brunneoviolaceus CBS 621.78]RAH47175.1 ankyrin [Aspergillus brunneoviolaceus CBS 621.78]